jgi:hypothetical protein
MKVTKQSLTAFLVLHCLKLPAVSGFFETAPQSTGTWGMGIGGRKRPEDHVFMARRGIEKSGTTTVLNLLQCGVETTRMLQAAVGEEKREKERDIIT